MNDKPIIIIGAGLSGTLMALRMAQRGYNVELFERRPDMRWVDISAGRSINLALSDRGVLALEMVGMKDEIMRETIPMRGRLVHLEDGSTPRLQPYSGREGEWINSVSRGGLNIALLEKADTFKHLKLHFNMKCIGADLKNATVRMRNESTGQVSELEGQIIIGADGSGSAIRKEMENIAPRLRFSHSLSWLPHGYKELHIPATASGGWRIEKEALHIWPRGSYMLIGLPNLDGSFTMTLFMPFEGNLGFDDIQTPEQADAFFKEHFADVAQLMPDLKTDYFENPTSALGTVKCYPWQAYGKVVLIGDAAHAVVPFYGQGMNASFEDCVVLDGCIEKYEGDWEKIFKVYQDLRKENGDAIGDLAEENYYEMADHVADPNFSKKRKIEMRLERKFPDFFSKYSMVTFNEDMPYADAMKLGRAQDAALLKIVAGIEDVETADLTEVMRALRKI